LKRFGSATLLRAILEIPFASVTAPRVLLQVSASVFG
jgi:hypothetical protein